MNPTQVNHGEWDALGLVPPRRLGALLSDARADRGLTLEDASLRSGGRFSLAALASIERGTVVLDDDELRAVAAIYDLTTSSLVPTRSRLTVDLREGLLEVDRRNAPLPPAEGTPAEVLARYLAFVYSMRRAAPGSTVTLRVDDLEVLGTALDLDPGSVRVDLEALMRDSDGPVAHRHRMLRARVLIPAAGILVGVCMGAALVLVDGDRPASGSSGPTTTVSEVRIGTAAVQERLPDGSPGPTGVREGP